MKHLAHTSLGTSLIISLGWISSSRIAEQKSARPVSTCWFVSVLFGFLQCLVKREPSITLVNNSRASNDFGKWETEWFISCQMGWNEERVFPLHSQIHGLLKNNFSCSFLSLREWSWLNLNLKWNFYEHCFHFSPLLFQRCWKMTSLKL